MSPSPSLPPAASKPTLLTPLTGQALRHGVAAHQVTEWTAWAQSLRVAGYRVDPARLADQLLRHGCATVQDAFGHDVRVQVRVPAPAAAPARVASSNSTAAGASFRVAA